MYEPHFNQAKIADQIGDLEDAYATVKKALENYPEHADSKELFSKLKKHFDTV